MVRRPITAEGNVLSSSPHLPDGLECKPRTDEDPPVAEHRSAVVCAKATHLRLFEEEERSATAGRTKHGRLKLTKP